MTYESTTVVESQVVSGVSFTVAKMSFGRRFELMRKIRELARRMEFLEAGQKATLLPEERTLLSRAIAVDAEANKAN